MRCRIGVGPGHLQRATSSFPFQEQKFLKVVFSLVQTGKPDAYMGSISGKDNLELIRYKFLVK